VSNFHFDQSRDAKGRAILKEGSTINNVGVKKNDVNDGKKERKGYKRRRDSDEGERKCPCNCFSLDWKERRGQKKRKK
jgi:hypothetical protein